ncbi:hypothetical protein [Nocardia sp. NPDC049149]|uniref:hypothetical protein n=1 Tax=Nocardia sp. NPDC049149 TaxID=3364315 RepID=UPI0037164596
MKIEEPGRKLEPEEMDRLANFGVSYGILCDSAGLDPCAELDTLNELIRRATPH